LSPVEVSVPESFNPYARWLGIERAGGPSNHYELLRIALFQSDPQVISAAADAQMAKIRGIRPGDHVAEWQQVLDALAAAKKCLCDQQQKARYDEALRQRLAKQSGEASRSDLAKAEQKRDASPTSAAPAVPGKNLLPPAKPGIQKPGIQKPGIQKPATPMVEVEEQKPKPLNPLPPRRAASPTVTGAPPVGSGSPTPIASPFIPAGFPNRPLPGAPVLRQPLPSPGMVRGAGGAGTMRELPSAVPAMPLPTTPLPSAVPSFPAAGPAGQEFFDSLVKEPAAPSDETELNDQPGAARSPTNGASANPASELDAVELIGEFRSRPMNPIRAKQNSSQFALVGVGIAIASAIVVAAIIIANGNRHGGDAVADASSDSSTGDGGPSNPARSAAQNTSTHSTKMSDPQEKSRPHVDPTVPPPGVAPTRTASEADPLVNPPSVKQATPMAEPPKPAPIDPVQASKLHRLLANARAKLGERKQAEAKKLIASASQMANTPEEHELVDRVDVLEKYVGEFWSAVHDSLKALKPADEIDVDDSTKVIVVEASADSLTIHLGNANRRFPVSQIPSGLAVALAWRSLDANKPENKIFIGAFHLVDPKTGREFAKQDWNEAAMAGVDVKNLLPLLEPDKSDVAIPDAKPSELAIVPDPEALASAEKKLKDEMGNAFLDATSSSKKHELAKKLIEQAESADDPARRYVMWREARDLSADAGQPTTMIQAVDRLGEKFRIDPLDMKADALASFPPKTVPAARAVNEAALKLVDEALAAKRRSLADRFAQIALEAAKATKSIELVRKTQKRAKEIEDMAEPEAAAGS
jgi:hypothetical protein